VYPFSDSNTNKQNDIRKIPKESCLFITFEKTTNNTPSIGGKKRYMLLIPIYTTKIAVYIKAVTGF
jgi:hypothetical protein